MPVSRLPRPCPGSRRPGQWRLGPARLGRARGRASRSRPRGRRPTLPSRTSGPSRHPTTGCTTGQGVRAVPHGAPDRLRWSGGWRPTPPRRQDGYGEEHQADEGSDEGLPVLTSGPEQSGDQHGRAHEHRDDPKAAARGPFGDGPPPSGDAEREAGRSDHDVHAVADEEADQRNSQQQDRDKRENGESSRSSGSGATRVTHVVSPSCGPGAHRETFSCSCRWDDEPSDAARVWPSPCTTPGLPFDRIVGSGRAA